MVDIKHPEMAIVSRSLVAVGVGAEEAGEVVEYVVHYNLQHIVKIEPLNDRGKRTRRTATK